MSFEWTSDGELIFDEPPLRRGLVDTCKHGVLDERHDECVECAAEDAQRKFVRSELTAILPIYEDTVHRMHSSLIDELTAYRLAKTQTPN